MKNVFTAFAVVLAFNAHASDLVVGNPKEGQTKIATCIGCHGIPEYRVGYPQVYRVPKIGGQSARYIIDALHEYKNGHRRFDTMRAIASSLSEKDIADIAAYYSLDR